MRILGTILLFFAVSFLIYGQSLQNRFVRWDDSLLIYENPIVREISFDTVKAAFTTYDPELYIPLTMLSYQLDHLLWGLNPFGFHLTNLVLHTVNALLVMGLVWLLLCRTSTTLSVTQNQPTECHPERSRRMIVLFCGLLFLVHPLHTEAVAWASSRKDVLSALFFLLSVCFYLKQWKWRSILAFALGLLAKVSIVVLPVILLLIDWFQGRNLREKNLWIEKVPYVGLSTLFGMIGIYGKREAFSFASYWEKLIVAPKSTLFYMEKFFWPQNFSVLYPYTEASILSPEFFIPMIIVLGVTGITLWIIVETLYHSVSSRGQETPWYGVSTVLMSFCWLFYLVTLAPSFLNIARGGDMDRYFASDRYAYIPSVGLVLIVGFVGYWITRKKKQWTKAVGTAGVLVLLTLSLQTHAQSLLWGDTEVLLRNVLQQYGDVSHVAHNNMGNVYRLRGEYERAIEEYEKAIAIRPYSKIFANLGATYRRLRRYSDAERVYDEALRQNPDNAEVHIGRGLLFSELGQLSSAREAYEKALMLRSDLEEVHVNLGALSIQEGNIDEAINHYQDALMVNPYFIQAHYNLGVALQAQSKADEAIAAYEKAIRLLPTLTAARINLGLLYHQNQHFEEARLQFETILRYDPQNTTAQSALEQMQQQ